MHHTDISILSNLSTCSFRHFAIDVSNLIQTF